MKQTIVEILIDLSGSMGYMKGTQYENKYLIGGLTRLHLCKQLLLEHVVPSIDYADKVVIKTFRYSSKVINKQVVNDPPEVSIIYDGPAKIDDIVNCIKLLKDPLSGGTPITAAINSAVSSLKNFPNCDRKIILLTDGEENGGGNYVEAAKRAEELEGVPCKIFIIGVAHDNDSEEKSKQIASGGYYNIKSTSFKKNDVKDILASLKGHFIKDTIENIRSLRRSHEVVKESLNNQNLENVNTLKNDNTVLLLEEFSSLEKRLQEQVQNTQKILSDTLILKKLLVANNVNICATTLTIDEDYSEFIRSTSEKFLFDKLCQIFGSNKINWLNQFGESGKSYDFELLDDQGNVIKFIECKGTSKYKQTFYLTKKEWEYFLQNREKYMLYRIFNVEGDMNFYCIENLLAEILEGKLVPYLLQPEILKQERVYLTITKN